MRILVTQDGIARCLRCGAEGPISVPHFCGEDAAPHFWHGFPSVDDYLVFRGWRETGQPSPELDVLRLAPREG